MNDLQSMYAISKDSETGAWYYYKTTFPSQAVASSESEAWDLCFDLQEAEL